MPQRRSRTDPVAVTVGIARPAAAELNTLYVALGWGKHSLETLRSSIAAYTATICARTPAGLLVGYASVFSDRCLTTMFGELVVHPAFQRRGIGTAMMLAVETAFPTAPIYVKALGASRDFYAALGFRTARTPVSCMFRRPGRSAPARESAETRKPIPSIDAGSTPDRRRIFKRARTPM